jgi:hypothetical protein
MGTVSSFKERLAAAGPSTKTVTVIIGADLGLLDEYERVSASLDDVKPADSLAGNGSRSDALARLAAIEAALAPHRFDFRVRGLDDKRWERLVAEHPPRQVDGKPDPRDRIGWNMATFPAALVKVCVVEPQLDADDWLMLLGDDDVQGLLPGSELDKLSAAGFRLSRVQVDVPFWSAASPQSLNFSSE